MCELGIMILSEPRASTGPCSTYSSGKGKEKQELEVVRKRAKRPVALTGFTGERGEGSGSMAKCSKGREACTPGTDVVMSHAGQPAIGSYCEGLADGQRKGSEADNSPSPNFDATPSMLRYRTSRLGSFDSDGSTGNK